MKVWASRLGGAIYLLVEDPKKKRWIEVNLRTLMRSLGKRKNKRIRVGVVLRLHSLPPDSRIYTGFPESGYKEDWYFRWDQRLYLQYLSDKLKDDRDMV